METLTLNQLSSLIRDQNKNGKSRTAYLQNKLLSSLILLLADLIMIFLSFTLAGIIRDSFSGSEISFHYPWFMAIAIALVPMMYLSSGLYPGFGVNIVNELRMITFSTSLVFSIILFAGFMANEFMDYSRLIFMVSWVFTIVSVPVGRSFMRKIFGNRDWWGMPVMIIGAGEAGNKVLEALHLNKSTGLKPVVALDDNSDNWGYMDGVPVVGGLEILPIMTDKLNIKHGIIALPDESIERQREIISRYSPYFSDITIIPNIYKLSSLWLSAKDLGGMLGFEFKKNLTLKSLNFTKRVFDLVSASILFTLTLPLALLIAIVIKLDSRGSIFYKHVRYGQNGKKFSLIKFRSMYEDADERLNELLNRDEEMKEEFIKYHKLRKDPRLTRIGKYLRKFSLDEIPQFWNVIKGEMSLIGPRPIVKWEREQDQEYVELIDRVKPGISGLWQVTDRGECDFERRKSIDFYYISNWNIFLDLYIFARTIGVILTGKGGY